jgi:hypothetical protein
MYHVFLLISSSFGNLLLLLLRGVIPVAQARSGNNDHSSQNYGKHNTATKTHTQFRQKTTWGKSEQNKRRNSIPALHAATPKRRNI